MTINETHIRPQNPTTENRGKFVRNVIDSTHFLKNGNSPDLGNNTGIRSFSNQKAKAIRLSDYSFPVFIIRKPKQRSTYSKPNEGDLLKTPSVEPDA